MRNFLLVASLILCSYLPGTSQNLSNQIDSLKAAKRAYSLFHPVPKARLRPMSTDRPDVTESAYSVDAGHFQVETDVLRYGVLRSSPDFSQDELGVNVANLKLGLSANVDLQLVVESYTIQTDRSETNTKRSGFGDLTLRLKRNLWGNDGGRSALAVMPFVKLPTGRATGNGAWEGGVVLPYALELPHDWSFGTQMQATLLHDEDTELKCVELAPTVTVGHDIYRTLGGFVELAGRWNTRLHTQALTLNGGPIWRVTDNLQLDLGVNYPLSIDTETTYFLGLSFRR